MSVKNPTVFEDRFRVMKVNPDGKMYQRLSRIVCKSTTNSSVTLTVDIHSELYTVDEGQTLSIALARTLHLDGSEPTNQYDHGIFHQSTLMDAFDYVMHGLVFESNADDKDSTKLKALMSFGGLLMKVEGETEALRDLQYNRHYYLLIKKAD
jgi:DNA-directed RNA polymerase I, II, and III subunit RPABC3